ncbi:MAG: DUF1844 domain-containing protein [Armatimonadetes bacterium]|nr:DUF1844 domain-containing protein [Armatimonadota bacterium]
MAEQEDGFVFVDKRGAAGADPDPQPDRPADPEHVPDEEDVVAAENDVEDGPGDSEDGGGHPRLAARDRLMMCTDILHQGAWIALGLVTDPVTQQVEQDLAEARVLIDSVADLATRLEPMVDESIRRDLRNMVATLRMSFVNQSRR